MECVNDRNVCIYNMYVFIEVLGKIHITQYTARPNLIIFMLMHGGVKVLHLISNAMSIKLLRGYLLSYHRHSQTWEGVVGNDTERMLSLK